MRLNLQLRLLLLLGVLLALVWLALWGYAQYSTARTAAADIDARLLQASTILLIGFDASGSATEGRRVLPHDAEALPEFELATLDRRVLLRSPGFPDPHEAGAGRRSGFADAQVNGEHWRIHTAIDRDRGLVSRVATPTSDREVRSAVLAGRFITPLLATMPLLGGLLWLGVWQGLRPLRRIAVELDYREPADLQPLGADSRQVPGEVRGLVTAINDLFARLRDSLARQRAFSAAVAHELRTPLAGCKSQVQVARRADEVTQKDRALAQVEASLGGMEGLVANLLLLGRLGSDEMPLRMQAVDPHTLAGRVVAAHRDRAVYRGIELELELDKAVPPLRGDPDLLASMLGNLVANAIRYSPADASVWVEVTHHDDHVALTVTDAGPGIPEAERERVFDGFYRREGRHYPGSGLGLTIVHAVARAHGGRVTLTDAAGGGTRAQVLLLAASHGQRADA